MLLTNNVKVKHKIIVSFSVFLSMNEYFFSILWVTVKKKRTCITTVS